MSDEPSTSRGLCLPYALVIALYGALLLGTGLGARVLTRHETLAAYPATEMLRYGHWVVPMYAGVPRTAKPPTMAWLIAGTMKVTGSRAEWVPRVVSVGAALVTALLVGSLAGRFVSKRAGLVAGLVQVSTYIVVLQARFCEADMALCASVTAAFWALAVGTIGGADERPRGRGRMGLQVLFYGATGASFLLKGVGPIFVVLGTGAWLILRRDGGRARFLVSVPGIVVLLGCLIAWPVAAVMKYPPIVDSWLFELGGTYSGRLGHDPYLFYFYAVPVILMPWTPAVLMGLWAVWDSADDQKAKIAKGNAPREFWQLMACWSLAGLAFLCTSAFKHKHYALPMLPPCSIAAAVGMAYFFELQRGKRPRPVLALVVVMALGAGGMVAAWKLLPRFAADQPLGPVLGVIACVVAGAVGWFVCEGLRRPIGQLVAFFVAMYGVVAIVNVEIVPRHDDYAAEAALGVRVSGQVPAGEKVLLVGMKNGEQESEIAYYVRAPIWRVDVVEGLWVGAGQTVYAITPRPRIAKLEERASVEVLDERGRAKGRGDPERELVLVRLKGRAAGG